MKIGVVYPQTEFGADPVAIRDYAQTAADLGYAHVLVYDHVIGAHPDRPGGWQGPYTHENSFFDPFVLFSYMAGLTSGLEFVTGILILPQRETAVVAKQAACLDHLSRGRFRLGVGVGWNEVEMASLNKDFKNRGRRIDEQITVLNLLWTQSLVTFAGEWHHLPNVGINPLPRQQPIPIWLGGHADAVLQRLVRVGAGWFPNFKTAAAAQPALEKIQAFAEAYGRDPATIGLEPRLSYEDGDPDRWQQAASAWQAAGATHLSLNTMGAGLDGDAAHIEALQTMAVHLLG